VADAGAARAGNAGSTSCTTRRLAFTGLVSYEVARAASSMTVATEPGWGIRDRREALILVTVALREM
jgi:hypothetical protein